MSLSTREADSLAIAPQRELTMHGERTVRTSIPTLDAFFGGSRPGSMTLLDSSHRMLFDLTHILCVNGVSILGQTWCGWTGNPVNPYELGRICRRFGLDRTEVLDSIAWPGRSPPTQLVSLIDERLEEEVRRTGAGMAIVSCLPDMFQDKEMRWSESYQLIRRCVERLRLPHDRGVAAYHQLRPDEDTPEKSLKNLLYGMADASCASRTPPAACA